MVKNKEYFEKKRKSAMRMLLVLWLFTHIGFVVLYFALSIDAYIKFDTTINMIFSLILVVAALLIYYLLNYLLIVKGIYEFNLDEAENILSEKLKKSQKDFYYYCDKYGKASINNLIVDEWISLSSYGKSQDEIIRKLKELHDNEKNRMRELENEIQIIKEMKHKTFWSYLKSFEWIRK